MNESSTSRRHTILLTLAAIVVVGLSGCVGFPGTSDDVDLYPNGAASQANASPTTATTQTTAAPVDDATPTETAGAPEADSNAAQGGGGSSSGAADGSNQSTTTVGTTTTGSPGGSDACDEYDEQVGPHGRAELASDDEICITSWDDRPYPDSFTVAGYVGNPSGETIDHVSVEVTLYDGDGDVLARETDGIDDVGESGGFVVTFVDAFDGADAPEPDDVRSYRIHATVGSPTAHPTTTADPTAGGPTTETATASPGDGLDVPEGCEPTYAVDPVETQNVETVGVRDGEWTVVYGEAHNYWAYEVIDEGDVVLDVTLQGEGGESIATRQAIVRGLEEGSSTQFAVAFDVEADRVDRAYATWTVDRQRWIDALCEEDRRETTQSG